MSGGKPVPPGRSAGGVFHRGEGRRAGGRTDEKMKRRSNRNKSYQQHSTSPEPSKKSHKGSSIRNEGDQMVTPRPSIRNARKRNVDPGPGSESSEPQRKSRKDGAATEINPHISTDHHPPISESLESQEPEMMDCSDDVNLDTVPLADGNEAEDDKELAASPEDEDDVHHHLNKREPQDYTDAKRSSQFIGLNASVDSHQHSSNREPWSFTDTKHSSPFTRPNASVGAHQRSSYREHWSFTDTKKSSQLMRPNASVVIHQHFSPREPQSYTDRKQGSQFIGPNVSGSRFLFWKLAISLMGLVAILSIFVYCHWASEPTAHQLIKEREVHLLNNWKEIQNRFPNQHQKLWTRSKVLLKNHATTATHTQPVVLMFTAAQDAKKTLHCLARGIAGAYASVFNSSVVEIDGSAKKLMNSDDVKLDMDNQLSSEFKEGRKAAVIHHFQDLPPASSLLFYKYCDHENAAFKDVPILITVSLDISTLNPDLPLTAVEEMVHDFLEMKFCSDPKGAQNGMNVDKLSGLWSRIAHVVLPVRPENEIEAKGCPSI
ncbi:torsin-1A-interacting protein 2-like [Pristis pectinata]|uniref:torsin-1A-interacting protein 2-like n=1 Tax=Pristis pectinata TaxID=685728 RepID=UPI00223D505A|nr:torsin-1A-interacting protein 2-like [Pristis pectinata]